MTTRPNRPSPNPRLRTWTQTTRQCRAPPVSIDTEAVAKVIEIMRPAIQADEGDIFLRDVDTATGVVSVELTGACVTCPVSTATLKDGIETNPEGPRRRRNWCATRWRRACRSQRRHRSQLVTAAPPLIPGTSLRTPMRELGALERVPDFDQKVVVAWTLFLFVGLGGVVVGLDQHEQHQADNDEAEDGVDEVAVANGRFLHLDRAISSVTSSEPPRLILRSVEAGHAEDASNDWQNDVRNHAVHDWLERQRHDQPDSGLKDAALTNEIFEFLYHWSLQILGSTPPAVRRV